MLAYSFKSMTVTALLLPLFLLVGCKIQITVPEGGDVSSYYLARNCGSFGSCDLEARSHDCYSGESCVIEVSDFEYAEEFNARPWEGWLFVGWKRGHKHLCSGVEEDCFLSTIGLEEFSGARKILRSDRTLYLEPEFVRATPIDEAIAGIADANLRDCLKNRFDFAEHLISLQCTNVASLEGIEAFSRLRSLSITEGTIRDISPLASLQRLGILKLKDNAIEDIGPLAGLTGLYELDLFNNPVRDISALARLTNITTLRITGGVFSDISALADMSQMRFLYLEHNTIRDLTPLANLPRLLQLNVGHNAISDLEPISGHSELLALHAQHNHISDLRPVADLTRLMSLHMGHNNISDISPIAGLQALQRLFINNNDIVDINPISRLSSLALIRLSDNRIQSIGDALDTVATGGTVILSGNPLQCAEIQRLVRRTRYQVIYEPFPDSCT